eukprot:m.59749 g.59749  ORF g.59749 m.59749 type:complete len:1161 (+) comp11781_c0_seq1:362-3844(+)
MSVKVAVRCRPFNSRELRLKSECIVRMKDSTTFLYEPGHTDATSTTKGKKGNADYRTFAFDYSFWSFNPEDEHFSTQDDVFRCVGQNVLDDAFEGYNTCLFAYGQTGAGKSYSMMGGPGDQRGIIPRLCEGLFSHIEARRKAAGNWTAKVEVSYMEIYKEKVKDLLGVDNQHSLRVREHQTAGPYVEGITTHAITNVEGVKDLMEDGNKMRTVKATSMNDVSSRSHAIFQLKFSQIETTRRGSEMVKTERVSKISLVDLAGSEKTGKINAGSADRLKEGALINLSLTTLGQVISALAETSAHKKSKKAMHIPYRDSILTWLLKESLGGNSKTIMVAALSPASANYEETLSTLRYANQAKKIVNKAVVNEDATATLVRKLNEEITLLRSQLAEASHAPAPVGAAAPTAQTVCVGDEELSLSEVATRLQESEGIMQQLTTSWEEKLQQTVMLQKARTSLLEHHGILLDDTENAPVGVLAPAVPYLMNLNPGASTIECIVFYFAEGVTLVTKLGVRFEDSMDLRYMEFGDEAICEEHCEFHCICVDDHMAVSLNPLDGNVFVNGRQVARPVRLKNGDRIALAEQLLFCFLNPLEGRPASSSGASMSQSMTTDTFPSSRASPSPSVASAVARYGTPEQRHQQHHPAHQQQQQQVGEGSPSPRLTPDGGLSRCATSDTTWNRSSPGPVGAGTTTPSLPDGEEGEAPLSPEQVTAMYSAGELAAARDAAMFEYTKEREDEILAAVVSNLSPRAGVFPLLPAYTCYMMMRYCQSTRDHQSMNALLTKATMLLRMTVMNSHDIVSLMFWFSNCSELSLVLRSDMTLAEHGAPESQQLLVEITREAHDSLVSCVTRRLKLGIRAIFEDEPPELKELLGPDATSSPPRAGGKLSMLVRRLSATALGGDSQQGHPELLTVKFLVDTLKFVHRLTQMCFVSEQLVKQLFQSILYWLGTTAFNHFVDDPSLFTCSQGLKIRYNLTPLIEWARSSKISTARVFDRLIQAAQLLQTPKTGLQYLDQICACCSQLNSVQMTHILRHYRPTKDEKGVESTLIGCIQGRFEYEVDKRHLEQEVTAGKIQLHASPNFSLPFRISGQSHMGTGLTNLTLVDSIKEQAEACVSSPPCDASERATSPHALSTDWPELPAALAPQQQQLAIPHHHMSFFDILN